MDIRNYPSAFVVFALGQLLVSTEHAVRSFTNADLANPGAFHWGAEFPLTPTQPHYSGKVVILVDEVSQSQASTAMALRAAPNAVVVGHNGRGGRQRVADSAAGRAAIDD